MARISTYNIDQNVTAQDKFIGTDSSGGVTKNFTFEGVTNFLNNTSAIAIAGQNNFFFQTDLSHGRNPGTISFSSGGGVNTAFNSLTTIRFSRFASSGNNVLDYLQTLVDKNVILVQIDDVNNFGVYKLLSLDPVEFEPDFYDATFEAQENHGALLFDKFYAFAIYSGVATAPQDLQSVTDIGNTTDNNIIVENMAYTSTVMPGDIVTQELSSNKYSFLSANGIIGMGNGSQESKFKNTNVTNPNVILEFPDKPTGSYTIATTSDVPSTPSLQDVTTVGNSTTNSMRVQLGDEYTNIYADNVYTANDVNNSYVAIENSGTVIVNSGNFEGTIKATDLTVNNVNLEFPQKAAGSYTIATTADVPATPSLQDVTNVGNTTTDQIRVEDANYLSLVELGDIGSSNKTTGSYAYLGADGILGVNNGSVESRIKNTNVPTNNVVLEFPNKTAGSYTIATTDDISSGTVTSVGLTMPSAFSVTNSPITSSGDIAVTGAGFASQYVRGDGTLATLPTSASGGSSIAYYLNGGTAASVATYYQMSKIAVVGTGVDFTKTGNGLISQWLTDVADPNRLEIPTGNWNFEMYMSASSTGGTPEFYVELLKYDGATFTTIANNSAAPEAITGGTLIDLYITALAIPQTTLLVTDRLAIRVYIVNSTGGRTITMHTQNSHLCEIITNFAGGVTSLNGLTTNTQNLAVGTSGTDFEIISVTDTHTFNLPTASATNRGALSSANWSTFNGKQDALVSGTNIKTINGNSVLGSGNLLLGVPMTRQEFTYIGAQTFTLSGTPSSVYAVFVNGQELNSDQYSTATNVLTIINTLQTVNSVPDKVNILYTPASVGILEYYTKAQVDAITIATTAPLTGGGNLSANRTLSMPPANSGQDGFLYGTDFLYFSDKQEQISLTTDGYSGPATFGGTLLNIPNYGGFIPYLTGNETFRGSEFSNNSTTDTLSGGVTMSTTASTIARSVASTNYATKQVRKGFFGSVVSAGRYTGFRGSALLFYLGGGFKYMCDVYISDTAFGSGCRQFYGMAGQTTDLTYSDSVLVSSLTNIIGVGSDAADTNLQVFYNDATGTATKIDLGANFPANRTAGAALTTVYSIELYNGSASAEVKYRVTNKETGSVAIGTLTTNLPLQTQGLNFFASRCMGAGITNTGQFDLLILGVYSL